MNPEIKAKELIDRFYQNSPEEFGTAKAMSYAIKMALICVDEIINALYEFDDRTEDYLKKDFKFEYHSCELQNMDGDFRYWDKVKKHLQNL